MNKKHGAWSKNEKIFFGLLAPDSGSFLLL